MKLIGPSLGAINQRWPSESIPNNDAQEKVLFTQFCWKRAPLEMLYTRYLHALQLSM